MVPKNDSRISFDFHFIKSKQRKNRKNKFKSNSNIKTQFRCRHFLFLFFSLFFSSSSSSSLRRLVLIIYFIYWLSQWEFHKTTFDLLIYLIHSNLNHPNSKRINQFSNLWYWLLLLLLTYMYLSTVRMTTLSLPFWKFQTFHQQNESWMNSSKAQRLESMNQWLKREINSFKRME